MTALQVPARSEGRKAMEDSLTPAEKVRRQLKAGRKPKTRGLPSLLDAVQRLCSEADRARGLMSKYGLEPDDVRLELIYRFSDGNQRLIGSRELPPPGRIGEFITRFESASPGVEYLGILWRQFDEESLLDFMWLTEFAEDKQTALELLGFKKHKEAEFHERLSQLVADMKKKGND